MLAYKKINNNNKLNKMVLIIQNNFNLTIKKYSIFFRINSLNISIIAKPRGFY